MAKFVPSNPKGRPVKDDLTKLKDIYGNALRKTIAEWNAYLRLKTLDQLDPEYLVASRRLKSQIKGSMSNLKMLRELQITERDRQAAGEALIIAQDDDDLDEQIADYEDALVEKMIIDSRPN